MSQNTVVVDVSPLDGNMGFQITFHGALLGYHSNIPQLKEALSSMAAGLSCVAYGLVVKPSNKELEVELTGYLKF